MEAFWFWVPVDEARFSDNEDNTNGGGSTDAVVDVDAARANVIGFKPLLLLLLLLLLFMIDDTTTDTDTDTLLYFTAVPCRAS